MKKAFSFLGILTAGWALAQEGKVGINTEIPKATLEIALSNDNAKNTATTNEGLLIPRMSRERLGKIAQTALTESTLVYINDISGATTPHTSEVSSKGFYYYNSGQNKWVKLSETSPLTEQDLRMVGVNNHITQDAGVNANGTSIGTGANNIAIGLNTLNSSTTGSDNIGIGKESLQKNTVGISNVAVGINTLHNNIKGNNNVATGFYALQNNTEGSYNVGVGHASGDWIKGNYNVHIGNNIESGGVTDGELDNVIMIGNNINATKFNATTANDNVILLGQDGNDSPKIGMGTYKPLEKLVVNGNIAVGNFSDAVGYPQIGNYLSFEGTGGWASMQDGYPNSDAFAFYRYDVNNDNSHLRLLLGDNTHDGNTDAFSIGVGERNRRHKSINEGYKERYRFKANGQAFKLSGVMWSVVSDNRLIEDIRPYSKGLAEIVRINPVNFKYIAEVRGENTAKEYTGVVAQDLEQVVPTMVSSVYYDGRGHQGVKGIDGNEYIYMLINAVKELSDKVKTLEAEVQTLKSKVP